MSYGKFLDHYIHYTQGNETPELFHTWIGLSILAGACEKRIWLDRDFFKIYMNLYIMLVSPAGLAAKSTSMGLGEDLLKEGGFVALTGSSTKEKIALDMSAEMKAHKITETKAFFHSSVTYISDELNVLLSTGADMIKFLVDIWGKDKSYVYRTKNSGELEIANPYFNIMGAVVPQWFGNNLAADLTATGFLARCILIYANDKRGKWSKPVLTKEQMQSRTVCLDIITRLGTRYGTFPISREAESFYDSWYRGQDISPAEDYRIAAYLERRNKVHVLKVATLLAIGDERSSVTTEDFKNAIHLFDITDTSTRHLYFLSGANKLIPHVVRLLSFIEIRGGKVSLAEATRYLISDVNIEDCKKVFEIVRQYYDVEITKRDEKGISWVIKK